MTKKDYVLIASTLKKAKKETKNYYSDDLNKQLKSDNSMVDAIAYDLAEVLQEENPKFDRQKFLTAVDFLRAV